MALYCLIHGGAHGPDGWNLLSQELEQRGHTIVAPALPLDHPEASATLYAGIIAEALDQYGHDPADTIAVAHSSGGMFLPLLAERRPVQRMVFIAALIPRPGISVVEQIKSDPEMFNPEWIGKDPTQEEVALEFEFHDCPEDRLQWALSIPVYFVPERAMMELCPLESWPEVPSSYVVCAEDRTLSPSWQRYAARERLEIEPVEVAGGHCPQVCRPGELADALEA